MIAKPRWLRRAVLVSERIEKTRRTLKRFSVNTVCESANCPNLCECFDKGVATFIILGEICTRGCRFCAVRSGIPLPPAPDEAVRVYEAVAGLGLKYVVITSVTRDDLPDGGAEQYAATVSYLRERITGVEIEVLVPDFRGSRASVETVLNANVDVFAHNLDTIRRLHKTVKPKSDYDISLGVFRTAKEIMPHLPAKSGLMLGLGETEDEVIHTMKELRAAGCDIMTLGQYLKPAGARVEESGFIPPKIFAKYEEIAYNLGFTRVSSGPFVRSSYHAACLNKI